MAAASVLCIVKQQHCSPSLLILYGLHVTGLGERLLLTAVWQQILLHPFPPRAEFHLPYTAPVHSASVLHPLCFPQFVQHSHPEHCV